MSERETLERVAGCSAGNLFLARQESVDAAQWALDEIDRQTKRADYWKEKHSLECDRRADDFRGAADIISEKDSRIAELELAARTLIGTRPDDPVSFLPALLLLSHLVEEAQDDH